MTSRRNKKYVCDVCKKVIMGDEQWHEHLRGRVHRRHVEGLKKKQAAEKRHQEKVDMRGYCVRTRAVRA